MNMMSLASPAATALHLVSVVFAVAPRFLEIRGPFEAALRRVEGLQDTEEKNTADGDPALRRHLQLPNLRYCKPKYHSNRSLKITFGTGIARIRPSVMTSEIVSAFRAITSFKQ